MTQAVATRAARGEELVGRLFEAMTGTVDIFSIYIGEQLGYYRALAEGGAMTPAELARRTGTNVRYTREWLEQQAVTEILEVTRDAADPEERRFELPAENVPVLTDPLSDLYITPIGRFLTATAARAPELLQAFRAGGGVSWASFGPEMRTAQADFNRPFYANHLVEDYLSQVPEIHSALNRSGARVAEIGPGGGWAAIAIARAYPDVAVDGFELDEASVEMARSNIMDSGLDGRVKVHHRDASAADLTGSYDLVCAFECIHDMPDPVGVLGTMRRLAKDGGTVLVMDERVPEAFGPTGGLMDRMFYGFSILVCLPDGMSHTPSAATGTVMRAETLRGYAHGAGFRDIEILPLEHDLFRFYRMLT